MGKKYTQINNLVTASRENLHKAYDRGYEQAKKEYKRNLLHWKPECTEGGVQFRCDICNQPSIAAYLFCPNCGNISKEKEDV